MKDSNHYDLHNQAMKLVGQMTLEEKAALCSGKNFWQTKGIERLGLKEHMLTDGPHGLRKQVGASDHLGINHSVPATSFPTAATTACSFDPSLLQQMGESLGEKCIREDVSVLLGPGINMKRSPLCGRNFEYFSEDPYLTGELASALVTGIQSKGVGTSLKHFAANNQEEGRMACDSVVDERALREIYLSAFEKVVKDAKPWTVMCSYNKINGTYASDNHWLLAKVLREEWGFDGLVVTDWGGNNDRIKSVAAGTDLEMPYSGEANANRIIKAVQKGDLQEEVLNQCVGRITELYLKMQQEKQTSTRTEEADHELAKKIAEQSMVLLKNDGILPLKENEQVAFLGEMAKTPRYQGAGSSKINPSFLDNAYDSALKAGYSPTYAPGYHLGSEVIDEDYIANALEAAKRTDQVVIFAGLPDEYESEGFDRCSMDMPKAHNHLIEEVAKVNPNVVVVLQCGSPVTLPWKDKVKGILVSYLSGQAGGSAVIDLLWGKENPSGKLAESWPASLEMNPSYLHFPGRPKAVEYRESIFIGYRYYDAANCEVNYPFGYGLSYTTFTYHDLHIRKVSQNQFDVSVKVENTGNRFGREIVQLYVSKQKHVMIRAPKELKGFQKVALEPGECKTVTMTLTAKSFAYYNVAASKWCIEGGDYTISIGSSSRNLLLEETVGLVGDGQEKQMTVLMDSLTDYHKPTIPFAPSDEQFTALLGHKPPTGVRDEKEPFTPESTIDDIKDTKIGKKMIRQMEAQLGATVQENADAGMQKMAQKMFFSMPLRSLAMTGTLTLDQIDGMVAMANGHYIKGIRMMKKK